MKKISTFADWLNETDTKIKQLRRVCEAWDPDLDNAPYNEFGERQRKCDEKHPACQKFMQCLDKVYVPKNKYGSIDKDRIGLHVMHQVGPEQDPWQIAVLFGGANGPGEWDKYLGQVKKLVVELKKKFKSVWIVDWINDCADDVYTLRIGVR